MRGLLAVRAVAAVACGHVAAMAIVAAAVAFRLPLDRQALLWLAGLLLVAALVCRFHRGYACAGRVAMALWSFITATAHGAGFMLMPSLVSLCGSGAASPLLQTLAAAGLHLAVMLAANGALIYGLTITLPVTWRAAIASRARGVSASA